MKSRIIREGFFKNEALAECSAHARLLFVGLWMVADREGLFEWRPKRIKAEVFPYETVKIESLLKELETIGLVVSYQVDGEMYGCISNFLKHQSINKHEKQSTFPKPDLTQMHMHPDASTLAVMHPIREDKVKVKVKVQSKVEVQVKVPYGEGLNVLLSDDEHIQLTNRHGANALNVAIDILDAWIASKPDGLAWFSKKYSSAFAVLNPKNSWVWQRVAETSQAPNSQPMTKAEIKIQKQMDLIAKYKLEEEQADNEKIGSGSIIDSHRVTIPNIGYSSK